MYAAPFPSQLGANDALANLSGVSSLRNGLKTFRKPDATYTAFTMKPLSHLQPPRIPQTRQRLRLAQKR